MFLSFSEKGSEIRVNSPTAADHVPLPASVSLVQIFLLNL